VPTIPAPEGGTAAAATTAGGQEAKQPLRGEPLIRAVVSQRDAAVASASEARRQLALRDAEVAARGAELAVLREQLTQAQAQVKLHVEAQPRRPDQQKQQQAGQQGRECSLLALDASGPDTAAAPWSLHDLPPTPGSGASYWLGSLPSTGPGCAHGATGAAATLLAPGAALPLGGEGQAMGPEAVAQLRAALTESELQNKRLHAIISGLRAEVEGLHLHHAAARPAPGSPNAGAPHSPHQQRQHRQQQTSPLPGRALALSLPGTDAAASNAASGGGRAEAALLRTELAALDDALAHALQHVAVLQAAARQVSAAAVGPGPDSAIASSREAAAAGAEPQGELEFLRRRVATLLADNRALRRAALVVRLAVPAGGEGGGAAGGSARLLLPFGSLAAAGADGSDGGGGDDRSRRGDGAAGQVVAAGDAEMGHGQEAREDDAGAELAQARALADALTAENERLMEISNSLRAERDRLVAQLGQQQARSGGGGGGGGSGRRALQVG
jgi:hypothetical protein